MTESRDRPVFDKSFTRQEAIPESGLRRAAELLESGRLHRYDTPPGAVGDVDALELEFAAFLGVPYALACASGGYALHIALRSAGVSVGDRVLTNAFTLAPVPGAIHNCGARPIFVEVDEDCCIDLDDLESKARTSSSTTLLLSHMRGHLPDMDRVLDICARHSLFLIEDCAHTMGATLHGRMSGSDADIACFSTQTYKHINSGEGGLLTTRHDDVMAKAILLSGSYMHYAKHQAAPDPSAFEKLRLDTPNYSGRMDNLRAAILRPQLTQLLSRRDRWNSLYRTLESELGAHPLVRIPARREGEVFVGSSIQFSLPSASHEEIGRLARVCADRGVTLKWFGRDEPEGYTSRFDSWRYLGSPPDLPNTTRVLSTLLDLRIPLTFDERDCALIAEIICESVDDVCGVGRG